MKTKTALVLALLLVSLAAGCAPEDSLFPLFTKSDSFFDEKLVGAWRIRGSLDKVNPDDAYIILSEGEDKNTYLVRALGVQKASGGMFLEAKLVQLGKYMFIDFGTPENTEKLELHDLTYPAISCHIFGRVRHERNYVRVDLLDDDWVKKQIDAGKFELAHIKGPNELILTAPTEELRKFALAHAEDEEAFSFTQYWVKEQ